MKMIPLLGISVVVLEVSRRLCRWFGVRNCRKPHGDTVLYTVLFQVYVNEEVLISVATLFVWKEFTGNSSALGRGSSRLHVTFYDRWRTQVLTWRNYSGLFTNWTCDGDDNRTWFSWDRSESRFRSIVMCTGYPLPTSRNAQHESCWKHNSISNRVCKFAVPPSGVEEPPSPPGGRREKTFPRYVAFFGDRLIDQVGTRCCSSALSPVLWEGHNICKAAWLNG